MRNIPRRWWPAAPFERAVAIFFAMVLIAFVITTFVNAPLSYDGSYSLFRVLDNHNFAYDYDRVVNIPLQVPVLAASYLTQNMHVLSWAFSVAYCSVPFVGLALSWLICRRRPSLFVWPAISICLGELPGRFFFTNEQVILATLFWPALLTALLGAPTLILIAVGLITIVAAVSQPVAAASLTMIFLVSMSSALLKPELREKSLWFALFVGLLLLQRLTTPLYDWEKSSLSMTIVGSSFNNAVRGWPLAAIAFTMLAALACLVSASARSRIYVIVSLTLVGAALITWTANPATWDRLLDFRYWATPLTLVLMIGAALEELLLKRSDAELQEIRRYPLVLVGTIFLVVLSIQSVEWLTMNNRLHDEMTTAESGCVPLVALNWLFDTPLSHWSGVFNAIELQGRKPRTLLLPNGAACQFFAFGGDAKLVDQPVFKYEREAHGGFFDFEDAYWKTKYYQRFD